MTVFTHVYNPAFGETGHYMTRDVHLLRFRADLWKLELVDGEGRVLHQRGGGRFQVETRQDGNMVVVGLWDR